uniref:Uncharacterized protein n=1 Tax=Oryza sativa subsp. japonica TaxID=39947 RepID=Q6H5L7_ORYSJ|nr:hypothetical protein [Oryza sativa Japonica Group]BAD25982.1 hypothetical protein [Oryza sativa Japonica Group]
MAWASAAWGERKMAAAVEEEAESTFFLGAKAHQPLDKEVGSASSATDHRSPPPLGDINTIVCYRSSPSLPQRPRSSYSSSSPCPHAFTTSTVAPSHPGSSGSVDPPVTGMLDSGTHCGATRRRIPPRGELAAESSWERS